MITGEIKTQKEDEERATVGDGLLAAVDGSTDLMKILSLAAEMGVALPLWTIHLQRSLS